MAVEGSAYLTHGLIYTLEDITDLRKFLLPEDKNILSPANLLNGSYIFMEVMDALNKTIPSCLSTDISQDQGGAGFTPSFIIAARSTTMEIDFMNAPFEAFKVKDLLSPSAEELEALKAFESETGRNAEMIMWGWIS